MKQKHETLLIKKVTKNEEACILHDQSEKSKKIVREPQGNISNSQGHLNDIVKMFAW